MLSTAFYGGYTKRGHIFSDGVIRNGRSTRLRQVGLGWDWNHKHDFFNRKEAFNICGSWGHEMDGLGKWAREESGWRFRTVRCSGFEIPPFNRERKMLRSEFER